MSRLVLAMIAAMTLVACAALPPPEPSLELDLPETWTAGQGDSGDLGSEATKSPRSWWKSFGEPDLDEALDEALRANPGLRATAAAIDAAIARTRLAGAGRKPQANVGLSSSKRQQAFVGLPIPGSPGVLTTRSESHGASLNVSWELDLWGRLKAGQEASGRELEAVREDDRGARLSLAGQTAKAWLATVEAEAQLALAERTLGSRSRSGERLATRYRYGLAEPLDVRLARAEEARAKSNLEGRRRQLDASTRQLEILLGRYPGATLKIGSSLPNLPPLAPTGLPAELLERRPDLRAAQRRLEAAGWRIAEAKSALYPSLGLTASAGTSSDSLGDLLDSNFSIWSLGANLLQPLIQGGRLRAGVSLAEAERERSLADYASQLLAAFREVEATLAAEDLLQGEADALAEAAKQAEAAHKLAEDRYRAGVNAYLAVLESHRQAFDAESRRLAIHRQLLQNRVDLHLALGGGFSRERSMP